MAYSLDHARDARDLVYIMFDTLAYDIAVC